MERTSLAIIDAQRGFMPASEGTRLNAAGFGELGVEGGEQIVERINRLTAAIANNALNRIVTTQDWHPPHTAHFSDEPNYISTWPVHCVARTPGALLHPDLLVVKHPELAERFIKGDQPCEQPQDDTSYTGALARSMRDGRLLPRYLRDESIEKVYVAGLALGDGADHPLCVDSTAIDLKNEGFAVTVVTDAVEAVLPDNKTKCFRELARRGILLETTDEVVRTLKEY